MRCPRCGFVDITLPGTCPQCGYMQASLPARRIPQQVVLTPVSASKVASPAWSLMRGDALRQGRYRLIEKVTLPENQQNQGSTWLAWDLQAMRQIRLLHRLEVTGSSPEQEQQRVNDLVKRMAVLPAHPGLPAITDVFQEQGAYYVVQKHHTGTSLAALIQQQGGALPERDVAEYGRQICEMLALFARQQPPIVHGSINTETIIVSPDKRQVSLMYVPLFPVQKLRKDSNLATSYFAPEYARGGEIQPSSDLYSLAATMHHAVTGFDPRERMVFFFPPARRLNPLVTAPMEAILARQLRFSTSQRYPGPEAMQQDLAALIATYPPAETLRGAPSSGTASRLSPAQDAKRAKPIQKPRIMITLASIAAFLIICLVAITIPLIANRMSTTNTGNAVATSTAQVAHNQAALNSEMALELQNYQKKGIGVSDGRLVFDTYPGRTDVNLKQQAATALQQRNIAAAVNFLNEAVNADPTDGEAQIYNEDMHIQLNNSPYVTLALGMPIDGSATYLGTDREQLEAVYLAQHETNSGNLLPNGLKLRIIIANSGTNNGDVATAAQFIANRVSNAGNLDHLVGVIGWYTSSQTTNARDIIASAHLPLIASVASSVKLSGSSSYFFRVAPPDDLQGQVLGTLLVNKLKVKKVLILRDSTDSYSVSLADAVAGQITQLGGTFTAQNFSENATTVAQYQQIVENNANSAAPAEVIFLAGFNVDGIRLAHAVGNAARANPVNMQLSQLRVVGGDGMDSGLLLGQGNNADAQIAAAYPQDMRRLVFTTFADFNEWSFLHIPQNKQPPFFNDWKSTYQSSMISGSVPNPAYTGLMIYDAVGVYVDAIKQVKGTITGDGVRNVLATIGVGQVAAYQGISGQIAFDKNGNPVNKALVILTVQEGQHGNEIVIQQVVGNFN
ncbi:MAG TPA: protein kinase [Ktedonobacteraceae bacterium]|nr:protein kinase [Ktedonobacteraceae bacterium]